MWELIISCIKGIEPKIDTHKKKGFLSQSQMR